MITTDKLLVVGHWQSYRVWGFSRCHDSKLVCYLCLYNQLFALFHDVFKFL